MELSALSDFGSLDIDEWKKISESNPVQRIKYDFHIYPKGYITKSYISLKDRSFQRHLMNSVGGSVAANSDKEGNIEISGEGHINITSADGNTSVSAQADVSVNSNGGVSGGGKVSVEYEF